MNDIHHQSGCILVEGQNTPLVGMRHAGETIGCSGQSAMFDGFRLPIDIQATRADTTNATLEIF